MPAPVLLDVYQRLPVAFSHGEGVFIWDINKKRYLDALAGIAVTGLGHNHPAITPVIQEQAAKLIHTSNLFEIEQQTALATALKRLSGLSTSFFSNSGAEAVECAIKAAHRYGHSCQVTEPKILVFDGAFHGRTMGCISASSNPKHRLGFEPLLPGFVRVPFNDLAAVKNQAKKNPDIVAVLVEPIQGESGIRVPDKAYLAGLRQICDENQWLLMLDEIQTGIGRTGSFFCYEQSDIKPDVIALAKSLANGIPIGACIMNAAVAALFTPGTHGSTFGGNVLACATAMAVIETIEKEKLWENAAAQGQYLLDTFKAELSTNPQVVDIRGKGLMIGIELKQPCRATLHDAVKAGVLFNIANQNTIRLLPPLIINREQTEWLAKTIIQLVSQFSERT
jgi:acetylornithine/N-succinyldiaminopimelate aminotransferase